MEPSLGRGVVDIPVSFDAWEAAGGNPGIRATREELVDALREMDAVVDEVDAASRPRLPSR